MKGRIIKGVGGTYFVATDNGVIKCSIRGIFRKNKIIPTVGDYVEISILEDYKGIIEKIFDRKNILIRPKVSNIDCAIITFAIKSPNINLDLLDRFLVLAESQNIENILICINKCDLSDKKELEEIEKIYKDIYPIVFTSTKKGIGIQEIKEYIKEKVVVFAGPSGVGKSSLINSILPDAMLKTGDISKKIERGKHTTRQVELIEAFNNTYFVDTPGFTSLSLDFIPKENLQYYFKEFRNYLEKCKFCDCSHIKEPNCAIKDQLDISISKNRYDRYIRFYQELEE